MTEKLDMALGSGNPFQDVGLPEADTKLIKADLAAEIIGVLRERELTGPPPPSWRVSQRRTFPAFARLTCRASRLTGWWRF